MYIYICMYVCIYINMYNLYIIYICMYVCVCISICMYVYFLSVFSYTENSGEGIE